MLSDVVRLFQESYTDDVDKDTTLTFVGAAVGTVMATTPLELGSESSLHPFTFQALTQAFNTSPAV